MNELIYKSRMDSVSLSATDFTVQTATSMRGYEWTYDLGRRAIYSPRRQARTVDVGFVAKREELEKLRHLADRDLYYEEAGKLIAQDIWEQSAYITGIGISSVNPINVYGTLKVLLLDGCWSKTEKRSFTKGSASSRGVSAGLDYPHDYKFDYAYNQSTQVLNTYSDIPCEFTLTIYGACVNPSIIIGKNTYQINATVPPNAVLIVDSREKTVILRDEHGFEQNVFNKAVRGEGKGKGSYIFEPLPAQESNVTWDNSFGFDVYFYVTESTPPFCQKKSYRALFSGIYLDEDGEIEGGYYGT